MAACGASEPAQSSPATEPEPAVGTARGHAGHGAGTAVEMTLIQFKPGIVDIPAGAKVTWTQNDAGFHTVTSGTVAQASGGVTPQPDRRFQSARLGTDETFEFRFDRPGTYPYFCEIHPATMTGEVRVGA